MNTKIGLTVKREFKISDLSTSTGNPFLFSRISYCSLQQQSICYKTVFISCKNKSPSAVVKQELPLRKKIKPNSHLISQLGLSLNYYSVHFWPIITQKESLWKDYNVNESPDKFVIFGTVYGEIYDRVIGYITLTATITHEKIKYIPFLCAAGLCG